MEEPVRFDVAFHSIHLKSKEYARLSRGPDHIDLMGGCDSWVTSYVEQMICYETIPAERPLVRKYTA